MRPFCARGARHETLAAAKEMIMRIIVVGGSAAGQFTALLLARAGHEVLLLDRDPVEPAADIEAAAAGAFRPAVPQFVQPHVVLPRCRLLLRQALPDVYAALLAAGAREVTLASAMPATLSVRTGLPGDDEFTSVATRRSTLDWVLRHAVASESGLQARGGVRATGLLAQPGSPPRVTGCATTDGDLAADLVVDAAGRRSAIDSWLQAVGAQRSRIVQAECGLAYYSRHYRLRPGATLPGPETTRVVLPLTEFTTGIWGSDNHTMLITIAPLIQDKRFRGVTDPDVFTAVAKAVPVLAPWLAVMDPISEIYPMGGLHNSMRRLVVDGVPVATGLAAVGDSVCITNPTLGRGLALALQGALDLVRALDQRGEDGSALPEALDDLVTEHVKPFYLDQAANDGRRLAQLRHNLFGAPAPATAPGEDRVTFAALSAAMPYDALVFRAFWRVLGMLAKPDEVYTDPRVVARAQDVLRRLDAAPTPTRPTRAELEAALV
jgi:2-polyprenyl-6-methoxyphenol hydroxylase-like FAD-dependent oxidoreductase